MTTITFKQRNTTPELLRAGCSSLAIPDPNFAGIHAAQVDGSTGTTQYTRTITGSAAGAASEIMLAGWTALALPNFPYGGVYEAGDWICRLNVSQANSAVLWSSVYICVNLTGTGWVTIASQTNIDTILSAGTRVVTLTTVSPTDLSAAGTPYLYWFYGFQKVGSAEQTFKYRSNKNLATPIVAKVAVPTATFATASITPTAEQTGPGTHVLRTSSRGVIASAGAEAHYPASAKVGRAFAQSGGIEGAAVSVAMEERFVLTSGGPEASSLGQG